MKLWKACNDFQKTPVGLAKRARAVLLLAEGESFSQTSEWVGLGERHLRKWARRFTEQGVEGLQDRPRPGRVPVFSPQVALYLVKMTCAFFRILKVGLCRNGTARS